MADELIYQSIHTGAEIDQLLGSVKSENLLDNSDFTNPVNHRGLSVYENATRTTNIDRWVCTPSLSMSVSDGKISVTNGATGRNSLIQNFAPQKTPQAGEAVTIAIKTADGAVHCGSCKTPVNAATYSTAFTMEDGTQARIYSADNTYPTRFALWVPAGATIELVWAAVYKGEYTIDTLPTYHPKGYAAELAECSLYFERIAAKVNNLTIGVGSGTAAEIYVPIKISSKRATPAAFASEQVAGLRYGTNNLGSTPTACTIYSSDNTTGIYTLRVAGSFAAGTVYRLGVAVGNVLDFNSEI